MLVAFSTALADMIRFKKVFIWLIIGLVVMMIAGFMRSLLTDMSIDTVYDAVVSVLVFRLLALAAAIFSTMVISQEVEQKTIVYLLARPIPRVLLLLGRAMAAFLMTFLVGTLILTCCVIGVFGIGQFPIGEYLTDVWAIFCGTLAYGGLFVFFSLIANRAMIYCLLFAFGWEMFAANMPGDLAYLSPLAYLNAISSNTSSEVTALGIIGGALETITISPLAGSIICLIWGLLFLSIAAFWFRIFEYTPREDAD